MAKPKPSTPPGTNSFGRTYEEQTAFEKEQMAKKLRAEGEKTFMDKIFEKKTPLKKGQTFKVMKGSPNMAKRVALKKKMGK